MGNKKLLYRCNVCGFEDTKTDDGDPDGPGVMFRFAEFTNAPRNTIGPFCTQCIALLAEKMGVGKMEKVDKTYRLAKSGVPVKGVQAAEPTISKNLLMIIEDESEG